MSNSNPDCPECARVAREMQASPGAIVRGCSLHSAEHFLDEGHGLTAATEDGCISCTASIDTRLRVVAVQLIDPAGNQMRLLLPGDSARHLASLLLLAAGDLERQEATH